jgi:ABC-type transport system substrate-binding protein/DNA-binding SARP family transcriptional activator
VLGPVEAAIGGRSLPLGARKQRAVLAMLVLEANRPVSADRLIEGLWGETAPPSAAKMVQLYISQLRKTLRGTDVAIETRGRGYQLTCEPDDVDVVRAERLVATAAEETTANGHAREALALWRGPPLADVADEPFAAAEIRRCEELWLRAKELAIDSELAAGRHEEALRELAGPATDHPLREHFQAQRMLALYRSGRQAEALEAYRAARTRLVDEIGSEPGPELRRLHEAILHQDPALDAPERARPARAVPAARPASRGKLDHRALIVTGAALACAAAVAVVVWQTSADDPDTAIDGDSVARIDAGSAAIRAAFSVGRAPSAVTTGAGSVWVANALDGTVTRIDEDRDQATTIPVGTRPVGLAFGAGSLWVVTGDERRIAQVDPASNRVVRRIDVGGRPSAIAAGFGSLWVAEPREGAVTRIDLERGMMSQRIAAGAGPVALAAGAGAVWVAAEESGQLVRLEPRSGVATASINVGNGPAAVAVGAGAVWVANRTDGTVSRIEPETGTVAGTVKVGSDAAAVAAGAGAVWVADGAGGKLTRVDAASGTVTSTIRVRSSPTALAIAGDSIWVATGAGAATHRGGRLVAESTSCAPAPCFDPAVAPLQAAEMLLLAYDGLVAYRRAPGAAGETLVGGLATSVPEPRDGGRAYVFTLRPGVRFSDGRALRAEDVRASLERAVRLGRQGLPGWFSAIAGAPRCEARPRRCDLSRGIAIDERARTVTLRLRHPEPTLLYRLAALPGLVLPAQSARAPDLAGPAPGTGPYRILALDRSGSGRLVRNSHFRAWSPDARPDGFADEIVFRRRTDPQRSIEAVEHGASDIAALSYGGRLFPASRRTALATRYPSRMADAPEPTVAYMFLNVREPPFDDVRVRRAVNFATDRARMVQLSDGPGVAEPACQVVPASVAGWHPYCPYTVAPSAAGSWTAPDMAAARRLIAASGTRGMRVRVWIEPDKMRFGRYFAKLLRRLGYRAELEVVAAGAPYVRAVTDPRSHAQLGLVRWFADYPTPASFFEPFSCRERRSPAQVSFSFSQLCDPALDRHVAAAQTADGPQAELAWARAARRLAALAPAVPLASQRRTVFTSARAGNVQQHPMSGTLLERVWVR